MGFYNWVRESVRQAVLLGFNDAVEQIGPPTQSAEMNEHLAAVLRPRAITSEQTPMLASAQATLPATMSPRPKRRRLGRSLGQVRPDAPKAA